MKLKNVITLSLFSLLLVFTACSASNVSYSIYNASHKASNSVTIKDYKNTLDYSEYIRLYTEINKDNNFYNGAYDLSFEGNSSKVDQSEEYISSRNTATKMYIANLGFNLTFDKDSKVYNCNITSNIDRNNKSNSSTDNASYKYIYNYTYQFEGNNFYSLNNESKEGYRTPTILGLVSNTYLVGKLLKDVEKISNNVTDSIRDNLDSCNKTYYVDGNVFTTVAILNINYEIYKIIFQETVNADNREMVVNASLTKNVYDVSHKLVSTTKKEYNLQSKLTVKDLNLVAKNVSEYNVSKLPMANAPTPPIEVVKPTNKLKSFKDTAQDCALISISMLNSISRTKQLRKALTPNHQVNILTNFDYVDELLASVTIKSQVLPIPNYDKFYHQYDKYYVLTLNQFDGNKDTYKFYYTETLINPSENQLVEEASSILDGVILFNGKEYKIYGKKIVTNVGPIKELIYKYEITDLDTYNRVVVEEASNIGLMQSKNNYIFTRYNANNDILEKIQINFKNINSKIIYLVHNIASESNATYEFMSEEKDGLKFIRIKIIENNDYITASLKVYDGKYEFIEE